MSETPQWFWDYIDTKPESHRIEVDDSDINYLTWSEAGKPGLLFVHGHNAHAHWWDFIAPRFKDSYHTVAIDLSGMGDSDHRDEYSQDTYAKEILAVAEDAGMPEDTVVVAHSFGGMMALRAVATESDRFKGLVLVDSGLRHPEEERPREPERWSRPKVYPNMEVARSRFRLQPPQQCANQYLVDHIARNSIEHDDDGWVWKFDEELSTRMSPRGDLKDDLENLTCRLALIYGELSESFSSRSAEYMQEIKPAMDVFSLADAQHHLFLDQPEAFMNKLEEILNAWR